MLKYVVSRFLLVSLSIETILQETTVYRRRQKLRATENGLELGGAYGVTLRRIKAQGGEKARLGMAVLMWISHSRRPLKVDEICQAVAIHIGSNDFHNGDTPAISTLLGCCQGLATVEKDTSTVRLIHFTLQEYLRTHPDIFDRPHSTIAETCLTYLNFHNIKGLSSGSPPDPRGTLFLEYSSLHWGTHMQMEYSDRAKEFALTLLSHFESHTSAKFLWRSIKAGLPISCAPGDKPFSALHCVSCFGIAKVADTLINMNIWDVNQRDGAGMTPLIWAARYGHEEMVGLLLGIKQTQPDQQDTWYGRTPLSWAAENGHQGVVRLFLGPQFINRASLGRRFWKGRRAAGLLRKRSVNPDSPCESGTTPLLFAVGNGHEGIVRLLLGREDVNPNTLDRMYDQTPLSLTTKNGHEGIVKLLLEREDVAPNTPGLWHSKTPLVLATENGHEGIVKLLLEREEVKPDTPDGLSDQTPLSSAVRKGHEGIVKLLSEQEEANPNTPAT